MSIKLKPLQKKGFTVVETFIVIAITGVLFLSTSLLIRGQVERYRYQDSMQQLQQLVQNSINDVDNGYFASAAGDGSDYFAGKRIYFCTDGETPRSRQPCTAGASKMRVENISINSSGALTTDTEIHNNKEYYLNLPGGLKYTKFYKMTSSAPPATTLYSASGGFAVMFNNLISTDTRAQGVGLYEEDMDNNTIGNTTGLDATAAGREDEWTATRVPSYWNEGKIFCFEGLKKGSIVIGRTGSMNVEMNLEDTRCN